MDFDRITFNPQILGGRAAIRGMRIPVSVIVGQIANGAILDDVPAFVRFEGPLFTTGPVWRIELTSPHWPE